MPGWDAKRAGFASVSFGRGLNSLGFLRQRNLHERHEVSRPAQNRLHFPEQNRLPVGAGHARDRNMSGCRADAVWRMEPALRSRPWAAPTQESEPGTGRVSA